MKKYISIALGLVVILITTCVYATTTFTATLESNKNIIKSGDEIEIILRLDTFTENEIGINVLMATLHYDKDIFEEVKSEDITANQYWGNLLYNEAEGIVITDSYKFINEAHNALNFKLKVKSDVPNKEFTEIKLTNINTTNGENDIVIEDALTRLQLEQSKDNANANNNVFFTVIAIALVVILGSIAIVLIKRKKDSVK